MSHKSKLQLSTGIHEPTPIGPDRAFNEKFNETQNSFFDDLTSSSIDMSEIPEISSSLFTISKKFSRLIQNSDIFSADFRRAHFLRKKKKNIEFVALV